MFYQAAQNVREYSDDVMEQVAFSPQQKRLSGDVFDPDIREERDVAKNQSSDRLDGLGWEGGTQEAKKKGKLRRFLSGGT